MKKLLSILMTVLFIGTAVPLVFAKESCTVYITVTDITDENEPFNYLVPRREIEVTDFDISAYGSTLAEINTLDGITYMHALVQLHRELYGEESVSSMLAITNAGETKYFMGRSVESIMYKNGNSILELPQNVRISDGDEINICLYNAGHQQGIASFTEAYQKIEVNKNITLGIYEHYGYPQISSPIEGAEIIDEKGAYIELNGEIVRTDKKGKFTLSFSEEGTYIISAMPRYNYYMSDASVGTVEWVLEEVIEKIPNYIYCFSETPEEDVARETDGWERSELVASEVIKSWEDSGYVVVCLWDNGSPEDWKVYKKVTGYTEKVTTQLVPKPVVSTGATKTAITHTTPIAVIDVTDDLMIKELSLSDNAVTVKLMNGSLYDGILMCCAYDKNENGEYVYSEMKTASVREGITFQFSDFHDKYSVMCWEDFYSLVPMTDSRETTN